MIDSLITNRRNRILNGSIIIDLGKSHRLSIWIIEPWSCWDEENTYYTVHKYFLIKKICFEPHWSPMLL